MLQEVPLIEFDDPELNYRVISDLGSSEFNKLRYNDQPTSTNDLGGCFDFGDHNESRIILWRYSADKSKIELVEISSNGELEGCALRIKLPPVSPVAMNGISWFHLERIVVLCICCTNGMLLVFPFKVDDSRNYQERMSSFGKSIFHSANISTREPSSHVKSINASVHMCAWNLDNDNHIVATTVSYSKDGIPEFHNTKFAVSGVERSTPGISCLDSSSFSITDLLKHSKSKRILVLTSGPAHSSLRDHVVGLTQSGVLFAFSIKRDNAGRISESILNKENRSVANAWVRADPQNPRIAVAMQLDDGQQEMKVFEISSRAFNLLSNKYSHSWYPFRDILFMDEAIFAVPRSPENEDTPKIFSITHSPSEEPSGVSSAMYMYDGDRAILQRGDISGDDDKSSFFYTKRLLLAGRYSFDDLRDGFCSCFGNTLLANQAKSLESDRVTKEQFVAFVNKAIEESLQSFHKKEREIQESSIWARLLRYCESSWVENHRPVALGTCSFPVSGNRMILIRRNTVSSFRPIDDIDKTFFGVETPAFKTIATLVSRHRECITKLEDLMSKLYHGEAELFVPALINFVCALPEAKRNDIVNLFKDIDWQTMNKWISAITSSTSPEEMKREMTTNAQQSIMVRANFESYSLQQRLRGRRLIGASVLLFLSCCQAGYCKKDTVRITSHASDWNRASETLIRGCFGLVKLIELSVIPSLEIPKSLDWLRRLSTKTLVSGGKSVGKSSILKLWIESELLRWKLHNSAKEHEIGSWFLSRALSLDAEILPFLDREQQYHVIGDIATGCSRYCSGTRTSNWHESWGYSRYESDSVEKYFWFVRAKALVWEARSTEDMSLLREASYFFAAATPVNTDAQLLLDYHSMVMKIFERSRAPEFSIDFAHRALESSDSLCNDTLCVLSAFVFERALDLRDYKLAYVASRLYPENDLTKGKYLIQLISVLVTRGETEALCSLCLESLNEDLWNIVIDTIERALEEQSSDDDNSQRITTFTMFYSFCIRHCRFVEAATCMYRLSKLLQKQYAMKGWTESGLLHLQSTLSAAMTAMRLAGQGQSDEAAIWTDLQPSYSYEPCNVKRRFKVTLEDIEKLFCVVRYACKLMNAGVSNQEIFNSKFLDACATSDDLEPLVRLLVDYHMWEEALSLVLVHDMHVVNKTLTKSLFMHVAKRNDPSAPLFIQKALQVCDMIHPAEGVPALQTFVFHSFFLESLLDSCPNIRIPEWLVNSFLNWGDFRGLQGLSDSPFSRCDSVNDNARNPAILVRALLKYGRIEDACEFTSRLISGMTEGLMQDSPTSGRVSNQFPLIPSVLLDEVLDAANNTKQYDQLTYLIQEYFKNLQDFANAMRF